MSKAHQSGSGPVRSRLPSTKSVLPDFGDLSESEQVDFLRDVLLTADPTTDRDVLTKVSEFVEEYPDRACLPISTDGKLRSRYVEFVEAVWEVKDYEDGQWKSSEVSELRPERAMCWADCVSLTLQRYRSAEQTELHFGHDDGSTFTVEASNRWKPAYQEKQLAGMHGWLRQAAGGDFEHVENVPDWIEVQGRYDNPKLVLFTRGASSKPDDVRFTPGEHESAVTESWSTVYDTLRNVTSELGVESWSYDGRGDPHPGNKLGVNACYGHEHVVVVLDSDRPTHEIRSEFRRVAEAHVRATPTAGDRAHDLHRPLSEWSDPDAEIDSCQVLDLDDDDQEIENVAGYVGSYASLDADDGLFERPIQYVAWAAVKDALNTRTMRRSESAVDMAGRDLQTVLHHSPDGNATIDSSDDDQEQTESVESSGWSLESVTTGKGTVDEETKEAGGKSSVKMVEVETARDEYEGMWAISPKHIDSPAELVDDNGRKVCWRYRDGATISGEAEIRGGYIRQNWGDVPIRDWWDYVQPHVAGEPEPEFPPV